jgi:hypothetical protein
MTKTADVVAGGDIVAPWGNEIRDRTVQVFATAAERDAQWPAPPNGAAAFTSDMSILWSRRAGVWQQVHPPTGPFVAGLETTVLTTQYGVYTLDLVANMGAPAGAKLKAATAVGAMVNYPHLHIRDIQDIPAGGTMLAFKVYNMPAGTPAVSAYIDIAVTAIYTM